MRSETAAETAAEGHSRERQQQRSSAAAVQLRDSNRESAVRERESSREREHQVTERAE